ncbi:Ig-like domain-containing protein [Bifidobacterium cuniculi]|uniref:Large protein with C-fibronectin type III domain protein n=1 Tax=Bifidobacterium cuniculi TaxID=1688 RepID=A0A087B527_9BIFI|nr:tandem-95 repeat protein [Bifidobacterium cuniculi]KFI66127.1 large protein with C- fibronectin type III domain protein [Bifidobacterium cuniculi]
MAIRRKQDTPGTPRRGARLRTLVRGRRHPWLMPLLALLAVLAVIVGAVLVSSVSWHHLQLDDGTVWVTSQADGKAARYNARLREQDASVAAGSATFDVAQHDGVTMMAEETQTSSIDAATVTMSEGTVTGTQMSTLVGGDTVVFLDRAHGNAWIADAADVDATKPKDSDPDLRLGLNGLVAVTHDGTVYGYRPKDGAVLKVTDRDVNAAETLDSLTDGQHKDADSFTVVDGTPVIAMDDTVAWPGGSADFEDAAPLTLQAPDADGAQSGWVAVASERGIGTVDLDGGTARLVETGTRGNPAEPVSLGGCVYGAFEQNAANYIRLCSPDAKDAHYQDLQEVTATSQLRFRVNHRLVVLNDVNNGNIWNPDESTDVIKLQWKTMETEEHSTQQSNDDSTTNKHDFERTCSTTSGKIAAADDSFGVRAGSHQVLDVLRNDEQTDCSVLRITSVSAPKDSAVTVTPIYDGRYLQLDASATPAGRATFTYEISDGHDQTAKATVTLDITGSGNRAPRALDAKPEQIEIEQGASYSMNALGGFTDPDGDPLTLVAAHVENTEEATVSTRADGQLTFNSGGMTGGQATVRFTVSDGTETADGTVIFAIRPEHTLAASIDPVLKRTTPGTSTLVNLKPYVHGTGKEPAQLTEVDRPDKAVTTPLASEMAFTFTAEEPGTYYVPYTITQGTIPATGLVRMEVEALAEDEAKPVAVNDTALLGADGTAIVEPLSNDIDPLGGVLSVTGVTSSDTSVKMGVVSNKRVYITAVRASSKPIPITYTVSNGKGESTGTIVLQPAVASHANSAPKASNVTVSVRTGGIVSVDVPDHVSYSDGTTITLDNELKVNEDSFKGLAFVASDVVRYQAPDEPGSYQTTYTVRDNDGKTDSATITFAVHKADAANKTPPTPGEAEAQVAAGQKIRVPITLRGIDRDGDDVQLTGLGKQAPELGRITEVGADYLIYEAYPDSSGTDVFDYAVEDWTGQRAQGTVRVGIFADGASSNVYARDDEITLRTDTSTTVPVLLNDVSSDDSELEIDPKVEAQGLKDVKVHDGQISFTTGDHAGTAYVTYTVANKAGLTDTATLTVTVDPEAPIQPPTAYDYRVPAIATIDRRSVDVDVSPWIANPSGALDELEVGVHPSAQDHASVVPGQKATIRVELTDEARAVPYTVTNTTYGITSTAFIQVPAYGVFPPQLRPKTEPLTVNAGEKLTIDIADYVRVGAGKTAVVVKDSVTATKNANTDLFKDDQTLEFVAEKDYGGPASITFDVTDGKSEGSGSVKHVNMNRITLPITVLGHEVAPPTFSTTTVDVVAGEAPVTIDLTALTHTAVSDEDMTLTYSGGSSGGEITSSLTADGKLTVGASASAHAGTTQSVNFAIDYGKGTPVAAGVTVRVVGSKRALARVPDQTREIQAGKTESVDVLSGAQNPFPDTPLTIISASPISGANLAVATNGGTISVTAPDDMTAGQASVLVTVGDATRDEDRYVTATVTFVVRGKPKAPIVGEHGAVPQDGAVQLTWSAPSDDGNSPIEYYTVKFAAGGKGGEQQCDSQTTCLVKGLSNGTEYGFQVKATNAVGDSPWSAGTARATPDRMSDAPKITAATGNGTKVTVKWTKPKYTDKEFSGYEVTLTEANGAYSATQNATQNATSIEFTVPGDRIGDSFALTAHVRATSRNAQFAATPEDTMAVGGELYGEPDPVTSAKADFDQNTEAVTVTVVPGAGHGQRCESVTLDSGESASCASPATITVPKVNLNERIVYAGTVRYAHSTVEFRTNEVSTQVVTPPVENLSARLDGSTCVYEWKTPGRSSRVTVDSPDGPASSSTYSRAATAWQTCPALTVFNHYKGVASKGASVSPGEDTRYKVQPTLNDVAVDVSWDSTDRTKVHVKVNGSAFDAKGKADPSYTITLYDGDRAIKPTQSGWKGVGDTTITVEEGDPDTLTWKAKVTLEPGYEAESGEAHQMSNSRPDKPQVDPSPSPSPSVSPSAWHLANRTVPPIWQRSLQPAFAIRQA